MRRALIALHVILGISAVGAGGAFVRDTSGAALGMTADWLGGSPFRDYLIPGLFLTLVIGGANLGSAFLLWRRHPAAPVASLLTGILLLMWVGVQTAIIGFRHWSQAIWWVTFTTATAMAGYLTRTSR